MSYGLFALIPKVVYMFPSRFVLSCLVVMTGACVTSMEDDGDPASPDEMYGSIVHELGDRCGMWSIDTLTKDCGIDGVYAGPNKANVHGGVCLFTGPQCRLVSSYTLTKACTSGSTYAGPNRPDLHGGVCLREVLSGIPLYSFYTITKNCSQNFGVYAGPNRPDLHGGVCLYTD